MEQPLNNIDYKLKIQRQRKLTTDILRPPSEDSPKNNFIFSHKISEEENNFSLKNSVSEKHLQTMSLINLNNNLVNNKSELNEELDKLDSESKEKVSNILEVLFIYNK